MDDFKINLYNPLIVGSPRNIQDVVQRPSNKPTDGEFGEILNKQIENSNNINFSKHAASRVAERDIEISENGMERLSKGIEIASEKKLNDALILVDRTAFIVNIPTGTVITAKDNNSIEPTIFTNINGTVIV